MAVHYEIMVYSGCYNIITDKEDGEVAWFDTKEHKLALESYKEKVLDGYINAYIVIKKWYAWGEWDQWHEDYGNEMDDCLLMRHLPKYIKKNIGPLLTFVCPKFTSYEEAKAFFTSSEAEEEI